MCIHEYDKEEINLTSKERFRKAMEFKTVDRPPCEFIATGRTYDKIKDHYGFSDYEQVRTHFHSDLRMAFPVYDKRKLQDYIDTDGLRVEETIYGYRQKWYVTGAETYPMNIDYPWEFAETAEDTSTGMKLILYTTPCVFSKEVLMQFLNAFFRCPHG